MKGPTVIPATSNRRRGQALVVGIGALALVSGLVVRTSAAVFTATTENTGNAVQAGNLSLTASSAAALFDIPVMEPGQDEQFCLTVTYDGTIPDPGQVHVYLGDPGVGTSPSFATDPAPEGVQGLADDLDVTVEEGPAGTCTTDGTAFGAVILGPTQLDAMATDYAANHGTWNVGAIGEQRDYRITVAFQQDTGNWEQDATQTGISFVWEVQTDGEAG